MPGLAEIALAGAPIAGARCSASPLATSALPDLRKLIKDDMELLDALPPEQTERRAELRRVIDLRIDDIIASVDKNRSMREAALSYQGDWRDVVVFLCGVLFTVVWWNVPHGRTNWLAMFVVMIIASLVAGLYAARGVIRAVASLRHAR